MKKIIFFFIIFSITFCAFSQNSFKPKKVGFLYNFANENNFLFDDEDYFYTTRTYKGQLFYDLYNFEKVGFLLIVQPQFQSIKHQLLNEQFVTPYQENFEAKRAKYTNLKTLNLYSLEFGLSTKIKLLKRISFDTTIGLGFSYIDETTERLAEGFTFIENLSVGFTCKTSLKTQVYLGANIGHVSNFDFQQPNSGYNIAGFEIGFQYVLK